jgi:plasmid segregation protein ParM
VTDIQIERVLNGNNCSLDPKAREIIQKNGRSYTERILSAIMEAGFDLRAIPCVFMGGGSSIVKRHMTPQDGLCRAVYLTDVNANAAGYERIVGQMSKR